MNDLTFGIIGCGWLGTALLTKLLELNHQVKVTCQSEHSKQQLLLKTHNIEQLTFPLQADRILEIEARSFKLEVLNQNIVVICIPPKFRLNSDYPQHIQQLVHLCELHSVQHVIMISTTSIYTGLSGNVDESTPLHFSDEKVNLLYQAEQYIRGFSRHSTILRVAGLVGDDRHPSRFMNPNKISTDAINPINLVHQKDVVNLILKASNVSLNNNNSSQTFNVVSNTHCSKQSFYQNAAKSQNRPIPEFSSAQTQPARIVCSVKSRELLNYQYQVEDLNLWLTNQN